MDPAIIVFGLAVGILVGLTGMGGGALMTPILILIFGVSPVTAIGTDLAYGAVTKTVGGWRHFRNGLVDMRLSGWMAVGSVPSAIAGVVSLQILAGEAGGAFDKYVLVAVAGALLLTGVAVLVRIMVFPYLSESEVHGFRGTRGDKVRAVVVGGFVGFVLGVTSAGSGGLIAVALILVFRLVPTRVVGTDVFHAAVLLWAATVAHMIAGNIDYLLAATILCGSVPGVVLGSSLTPKVPTNALRIVLAVVLIGSAMGLVSKAGAEVPPAVLVAVPGGVLAILLVSRGRIQRRAVASVGDV
ncbi:MAG: sulfite exporter TauE/SafE family protein [Actinomycetota bacterium]|nr:sulfite exporter TauE/SafE family protein [Actinomycetota bacterium]